MSSSASASSSSEYRVAPAKYDASLHDGHLLSEQEARELEGTCEEWRSNISRVLFSSAEISLRVGELAAAISRQYAGQRVLCVGLLSGAFVFLSDLVRRLTVPYQVDFMVVSSYGRSEQRSAARATARSASALTGCCCAAVLLSGARPARALCG